MANETLSESIERLQAMLDDDGDTWDLSAKDKQAIKSVLSATSVATIMPIIGNDGRLLGVNLNGVCSPMSSSFEWFAENLLMRIADYPPDNESDVAKALINRDDQRLAQLKREATDGK